jgi:hypothetical protein
VSEIPEEPPDDNEAFDNLDESLDEIDEQRGYSGGPEGQRDLGSEIVVDDEELEEAGANLDDPDQISLLDGGMDDPDGIGTAARRIPGDEDELDGPPGIDGGNWWEEDEDADDTAAGLDAEGDLEIVDVDPEQLEDVPDDAPGPG